MKKPLAALAVLVMLAGVFLVLLPATTESASPVRRPTPTPVAPPPSRGQVAPQLLCPNCADLIVESITTDPPIPTVGVTATIRVVIANVGAADVPDGHNFFVDLYVNPAEPPVPFLPGDYSWGAQSWYVPSGGSWVLTTTYRFMDTNTYALFAQIDTDNSVTETNELNNVLGPVGISVKSSAIFQQSTHQDFQYGLASNLDLSHPDGVITLGSFEEPWQDVGVAPASVYSPDTMINDVIASYSGGIMLPTTVEQVKPSIVADLEGNIYAVWQDARHGGTYNNRIYFSRSTDRGATWSPNISITADIPISPSVNQLAPRIAFDNATGQAAVVWQDNRDGHYDIYFSGSTDGGVTWSPSVKVDYDVVNPTSHKLRPSLVISDGGYIYVAWQDQRNGNDDVYMTRSEDSGATWWVTNTFVTDDPETTVQAQRSPSIGLGWGGLIVSPNCVRMGVPSRPSIYVAWEDWRDASHPEVFVSVSWDQGETFGVDVPVQYPAGQSYRVAPTMVVVTATTIFTTEEPIPGTTQTRIVTKTADADILHVAWQEGKDENADIYYAYAWTSYCPGELRNEPVPAWGYDFFFRPKIKISGYHADYSWAQPPEPKASWEEGPAWQGEVTLAKANSLASRCVVEDITYNEGVYIAWSDGRSFDRDRRDVYVARAAHPHFPNDDIKTHILVVPQDGACSYNRVVNNNVKLYAYRDDAAMWSQTKPANVRQSNPTVFAVGNGYTDTVYAAWDDDRWDRPLTPGTRRNRDVFFARTAHDQYGVYISPVFDTLSSPTTWYSLDWFGTTAHGTPTYFQTRTGNTPTPPKENAAVSTWNVFTGTQPIHMQNGPTDLIYVNDAPGQPIISPPGRYIQYKLIIDGYSRRTAVTQVTIHYETRIVPVAFLPLVMSNYTGPALR